MTAAHKRMSRGQKIMLGLLSPLILGGIVLSFVRIHHFFTALQSDADSLFISTRTFTIAAFGFYALMLLGVIAYGIIAKKTADKNAPQAAGQKIAYGLLVYGSCVFIGIALFSPFIPAMVAKHYGYDTCLRDSNYAAGSGGYSYVIYTKTRAACEALAATGKSPLELEYQR